jgi:redox-regulated HSP33 family molecular chaperone
MKHLNFYNWLLNEEQTSYVQKIKQLKNALGLSVQVDDEDGIKAAGNIPLDDIEKDNIDNFKTNYMYTDVGVEDNRKENQTAIDELLSSPNKNVSDLANLMVGLENK